MKHLLTFFLLFMSTVIFAQSDTIHLQGTASDPNGDALTYRWSIKSGPTATIETPTSLFTVVKDLKPGVYIFQLDVSDFELTSSATVTLTATLNQPPKADAGPNRTIILSGKTTGMIIHSPLNIAITRTSDFALNEQSKKEKRQAKELERWTKRTNKKLNSETAIHLGNQPPVVRIL